MEKTLKTNCEFCKTCKHNGNKDLYYKTFNELPEICKECYNLKLENQKDGNQYFVFNPDHGKPNKIYESYENALHDAENIASSLSHCNIYVLQVVAHVERRTQIKEKITDKEGKTTEETVTPIPF